MFQELFYQYLETYSGRLGTDVSKCFKRHRNRRKINDVFHVKA